MEKEQQIEEMARTIMNTPPLPMQILGRAPGKRYMIARHIAEHLYAQDHRKRSEPISCGHENGGGWISVKERLPEECKNVLCFARNKTMIAFMEKVEDCGEYVPVFWDWVAYDRDDTYDEVCATHWMPLPEPPKMKGGDEK